MEVVTPEEAGILFAEWYCLYMDTAIVGTEGYATNPPGSFIARYIRLLKAVMDGGEWGEQEAAGGYCDG